MKKYKNYFILTIFTMGSQAILYFLIKFFINDYNIINSIVNIPLIKPFVFFYDLWYPFILLNTFLIYKSDNKIFYNLISTMLLTAFMAQITFLLYPSQIIRPSIEINNLIDWLVNFTYKSDTPAVNCLPSMHCVYCFIICFYILKCKKISIYKKIITITFSILIVLSTLFIKQHILEDVILALIYTIISILIIYFNKEKVSYIFNKLFK